MNSYETYERQRRQAAATALATTLEDLRNQGIVRFQFGTYWYNDEGEIASAYTKVAYADGHESADDPPWLNWELMDNVATVYGTSYGVFVVDVLDGTVAMTGNLYMPEPELSLEPVMPWPKKVGL